MPSAKKPLWKEHLYTSQQFFSPINGESFGSGNICHIFLCWFFLSISLFLLNSLIKMLDQLYIFWNKAYYIVQTDLRNMSLLLFESVTVSVSIYAHLFLSVSSLPLSKWYLQFYTPTLLSFDLITFLYDLNFAYFYINYILHIVATALLNLNIFL